MQPLFTRITSPFTCALMLMPTLAHAKDGCANDVQCKGDRICVQGSCQDPAAPRSRQSVAVDNGSQSYADGDAGWTIAAGILGLVATGGILGLGGAAAATSEEQIPALPLGAAATVLGAVMIPIAAGGARSGSERGPTIVKVFGWITYGLFLANAVGLLALGAAEVDIDYIGPIASTIGFGALSGVLFSVDAFVANARARSSIATTDSVGSAIATFVPRHRPKYAIALGQVSDTDAVQVPTVGLMMAY